MVNLFKLTKSDLSDPEVFAQIEKQAKEIVGEVRFPEAFRLARSLDLALNASDHAGETIVNRTDYARLLDALKAVALPRLSDRELIEVFRAHLSVALKNDDINLLNLVDSAMLFRELDDRDRVKELLRRALRENDEVITRTILISSDGSRSLGSIRRWIEELHHVIGTDIRTISLANFFARSEIIKRTTQEEQRRLKKLFNLYALLHLSSLDFEGNEEGIDLAEGNGVYRILQKGQVAVIRSGPPVRSPLPIGQTGIVQPRAQAIVAPPASSPVAFLMSRYESFLKTQERLRPIELKIQNETKGDFRKLKQTMGAGITAKDRDRTLACLRVLARSGDLVRILEREQAVIKTLTGHLAKKYAATPGVDQALRVLTVNPVSAEAVSEFLQYVLKERLGMSEGDSALAGVELGMLLASAGKPEFQHLAYADSKTRTFAWIANRIEGGRFVREAS